jgi:hypothetical protein
LLVGIYSTCTRRRGCTNDLPRSSTKSKQHTESKHTK